MHWSPPVASESPPGDQRRPQTSGGGLSARHRLARRRAHVAAHDAPIPRGALAGTSPRQSRQPTRPRCPFAGVTTTPRPTSYNAIFPLAQPTARRRPSSGDHASEAGPRCRRRRLLQIRRPVEAHAAAQAHGDHVKARPAHQIQVKVVAQAGAASTRNGVAQARRGAVLLRGPRRRRAAVSALRTAALCRAPARPAAAAGAPCWPAAAARSDHHCVRSE